MKNKALIALMVLFVSLPAAAQVSQGNKAEAAFIAGCVSEIGTARMVGGILMLLSIIVMAVIHYRRSTSIGRAILSSMAVVYIFSFVVFWGGQLWAKYSMLQIGGDRCLEVAKNQLVPVTTQLIEVAVYSLLAALIVTIVMLIQKRSMRNYIQDPE